MGPRIPCNYQQFTFTLVSVQIPHFSDLAYLLIGMIDEVEYTFQYATNSRVNHLKMRELKAGDVS